jgi:cytochrome c oxidase assembly protein subunit 15
MEKGLVRTNIIYLLGGAVFSSYVLMVMGTFVTSTGSGLACPDWPLCYGSVSPPLRLDIWFEWGHRLLGGLTGILIIISTVLVWRNYKGLPRYFTGAVIALLCLAVLVGGVIVVTEAPFLDSLLKVAIVSSHLVISTLVLTLLVFTFRYVSKTSVGTENGVYVPLFTMVYIQVILGILVRYSGATLACPDFPLCMGKLIPPLTSYLVALHFFHRVVGVVVFIMSAVVVYNALRSGNGLSAEILSSFITFALIVFQILFGILIVLTGMFFPVIIMHGATGFLLLSWLAYQSASYFFSLRAEGAVELRWEDMRREHGHLTKDTSLPK